MSARLVTATTVLPTTASATTAATASAVAVRLADAAESVRLDGRVDVTGIVKELHVLAEVLVTEHPTETDLVSATDAGPTESDALGRDKEETEFYDAHFGIARVQTMSQIGLVAHAIETMTSAVADLPSVRLAPDYISRIYELCARVVGELDSGATGDENGMDDTVRADTTTFAAEASLTSEARSGTDSDATCRLCPRERWEVGHRLYALANRRAGLLLDEATALLGAGIGATDPASISRAVSILRNAENEIASVTATLLYAATLSAVQYRDEVRPTMAPPEVPAELTGRMNLDHAAYRAALAKFLQTVNLTYSELATVSPALAHAREQVLDLDLQDMGCHVALTHRLVRDAAALDEQDHGSAVQSLRSMEIDRAQAYAKYMRLGSRLQRFTCPAPGLHEPGSPKSTDTPEAI